MYTHIYSYAINSNSYSINSNSYYYYFKAHRPRASRSSGQPATGPARQAAGFRV